MPGVRLAGSYIGFVMIIALTTTFAAAANAGKISTCGHGPASEPIASRSTLVCDLVSGNLFLKFLYNT